VRSTPYTTSTALAQEIVSPLTNTRFFTDRRRGNPRATGRRLAEFPSKVLREGPLDPADTRLATIVCLMFIIPEHIVHGTSRFIKS